MNVDNKITCSKCEGSGYVFPNTIFPVIQLISCRCGHGGKAWHQGVWGRCTYGGCKCDRLDVSSAIISKHGKLTTIQDYRTLSRTDFLKFYQENKEGLIIQ